MEAKNRFLFEFLEGTKQFCIPIYQRNYSWNKKQWLQLWNDILSISKDENRDSHFFGSIACSPMKISPGFSHWFVVDGQQRLTTITLLFSALRDYLAAENSDYSAPKPDEIQNRYLCNPFKTGDERRKLLLRRNDDEYLSMIVDKSTDFIDHDSLLYKAYKFFLQQLEKERNINDVYDGINRLIIVDVTIDPKDNPQLIFESLNSTGVPLEQSDLVRNFMLMGLTVAQQDSCYTKYWYQIERVYQGAPQDAVSNFLRAYICLKLRRARGIPFNQIYNEFRNNFNRIKGERNLESVLEEMLRWARYHAQFSQAKKNKHALYRLNQVLPEAVVLVMVLLICKCELNTLTDDDFVKALGLLESYSFRRMVTGITRGSYWSNLARLAFNLDRNAPHRSLQVRLNWWTGKFRFPSDKEFKESLVQFDAYSFRRVRYMLDALENYETKEPQDTSNYTIEHVLPQSRNLRPEWQKMLGENSSDIQERCVHRLGNLTLTGYNPELSNKSFEQKKTMDGGFRDSPIRLNKFIAKQDFWTDKEINVRSNNLSEQAKLRWPRPEVTKNMNNSELEIRNRRRRDNSDISKVEMDNFARLLFAEIRKEILSWSDEARTIYEINLTKQQISYHVGPLFFAEVIPRRKRLAILLPIPHDKAKALSNKCIDLSRYSFIPSSKFFRICKTLISFEDKSDLSTALELLSRSFQQQKEKC